MTFVLTFLLACGVAPRPAGEVPYSVHGWREIPSPRPDLQCWTRFDLDIICAPSLTSTHGASL
jgi:hypothetical protein